MESVPVQTDLKIALPGNTMQKVTLTLSPTGDIQTIDGRDKLAAQLMRAIVNDDSIGREALNSRKITSRVLRALTTQILRDFRTRQIDMINDSDPNFSGFKIYRRAAGTNDAYVTVSPDPIIWTYTDSVVENGISYDYGISRVTQNIFESSYIDQFTVTPSNFINRRDISVGTQTVVFPENGQVTFYVNYNRKFKLTEIVDKILSIEVEQDAEEPRRFVVSVVIKDLGGQQLSIATKEFNIVNPL